MIAYLRRPASNKFKAALDLMKISASYSAKVEVTYMSIKDLYNTKKPVVSFEIFPPKREDDIKSIYDAIEKMSLLSPDFISVTYGASGAGNTGKTAEITSFIQKQYSIEALAHFTCVGTRRNDIKKMLDKMHQLKIKNILALRGDLPQDSSQEGDYLYAANLIAEIKGRGDFCIGAACYPEGHIDCDDLDLDIKYMQNKQLAGADFFITQLFFDNEIYFRFLDKARNKGVTCPISAGIMPILSRKQIERMIFMCGVSLPSDIVKLLHKYENDPEDLCKAGIEHAAKQIENILAQQVDGVHIYTMNKPDIARYCIEHIKRTQ